MVRRGPTAVLALLLAWTLILPVAVVAQDSPPVPRLRPPIEAPAATALAAEPAPTPGQRLLLQGANSPFADAGADAPSAGTVPLNPARADTLAVPRPPVPEAAAPPARTAALPPQDLRPAEPASLRRGTFTLEARLSPGGATLGEEVTWRIYDPVPVNGRLPLLGRATGGLIRVRLDPGDYIVHAAYGRAGSTRRIAVTDPTGGEVVSLNAGGMRLSAVNGQIETLGAVDARFDIYAPDESGSDERYLIVGDAPPGKVISLNAGTYHVVSRYGDANAIVRADIRVEPGQLTEATIFQHAAKLTLKLVSQRGGEAIANTQWSVVTEAGETVIESVGAFPNVVLSEGEYIAIARNNGRIFESKFTVAEGQHRDVEVLVQ